MQLLMTFIKEELPLYRFLTLCTILSLPIFLISRMAADSLGLTPRLSVLI